MFVVFNFFFSYFVCELKSFPKQKYGLKKITRFTYINIQQIFVDELWNVADLQTVYMYLSRYITIIC